MKHFLVVALLLLAAALVYAFADKIAYGSVESGSEYNYATTTTAATNTSLIERENTTVCVLGSVIIASSSATSFTIMNATSTTDVASTTLAIFEANAAEGTYTFDVACNRGLSIIAPAGFNGYVITTYR